MDSVSSSGRLNSQELESCSSTPDSSIAATTGQDDYMNMLLSAEDICKQLRGTVITSTDNMAIGVPRPVSGGYDVFVVITFLDQLGNFRGSIHLVYQRQCGHTTL
jgi:hypothetical protein